MFLALWRFFSLQLSFWGMMSLPVSFLDAFYLTPVLNLTVNILIYGRDACRSGTADG